MDRKNSTHSKFMVSNEVCDNEINVAFLSITSRASV